MPMTQPLNVLSVGTILILTLQMRKPKPEKIEELTPHHIDHSQSPPHSPSSKQKIPTFLTSRQPDGPWLEIGFQVLRHV